MPIPFLSRMGVENLLFRTPNYKRPNFLKILNKIARSYLYNAYIYITIIIQAILWRLLNARKVPFDQSCIYIDSYIGREFEDDPLESYLPKLLIDLKNHHTGPVVILARYVSVPQIFEIYRWRRRNKNSNIYLLADNNFLVFRDYLFLLKYMLKIPYILFTYLRNLPSSRSGFAFSNEFLISISRSDLMRNIMRYRVGCLIAKKALLKSKILQWNENQVIDRAFNFGIRSYSSEIKIIGLKFFIWPKELINIEYFKSDDVREYPDIALVCGSRYLNKYSAIPTFVGSANRYSYLKNISSKVSASNSGKILVVLPYFFYDMKYVIDLLIKEFDHKKLIFRFHPSYSRKSVYGILPISIEISTSSISECLSGDILGVVGMSSGALVEALALGLPVVSIKPKNKISLSYLPDLGKGFLWKEVIDSNGIEAAIYEIIDNHKKYKDKSNLLISIIRSTHFINEGGISIKDILGANLALSSSSLN